MKTIKITIAFGLLSCFGAVAQQPLTNTAPGGPPSGQNSNSYWSRAGNNNLFGINNVFGTQWNSPIYTQTDGINRTRLNGTLTTTINSVLQNVSGYFGISPTGFFQANSPWSMLHLDGGTNVPQFGGGGWRAWMRTGVFMKENSDAMYVGLKQEAGTNRSDAIINWSDDAAGGGSVDKLRFLFTGAATGNGFGTNPLSGTSFNGYEFMRMQSIPTITNSAGYPIGHIGIGPLFTDAFVPQSRLHLNSEDNLATFVQVTTQNGTASTVDDGLRVGVDQQFGTTNGYIRWQENTPFIIQTDWNGTPGGIAGGERMRITSISAPGVPDPANPFANITRVAISHNGLNPVTEPRSLLHLGYNTGGPFSNSVDGWRDWMDVGTFTAQGTDNMYVGLKREQGVINDRFDAIVNWGDNQGPAGPLDIGPDNLRFIFTSTTGFGAGDSVSQTNDGLEVARMEPGLASTMPSENHGMVGIGNFAPLSQNEISGEVVDAKLDIDGDLRIRTVTRDTTLTRFLVIDSTDLNRVHWTDVALGAPGPAGPAGPAGPQGTTGPQGPQGVPGASTGAHNGTSMSTIDPSKVSLGQNVGAFPPIGELLSNREIPMNNRSIYFTDNNAINSSDNRIGIGTTSPNGRLHIEVNDQIAESSPKGVVIDNNQTASNGIAQGLNINLDGTNNLNTGAWLIVSGAQTNTGLDTRILGGTTSNGVFGRASDAIISGNGVVGEAVSTNVFTVVNTAVQGTGRFGRVNHGGRFEGSGNSNGLSSANYGVYTHALGLGAVNYGIFATANGATTNYAGYFQGNVHVTGQVSSTNGTIISSDAMFKTNIADLTNPMALINQLSPRTFDYDTVAFPDFNFEGDQQMGLIAQEVELVIPTIVSNHIRPAQFDSLGVEIAPMVSYKGIEYEELIPLLIAGMQEQQVQMDEKDSLIDALNDRLTLLENCLSNILPALCQANSMAIQSTPEEVQEKMNSIIDVELSDRNNIVLNQNVPNPFAERTVISYAIPETVIKAQIHFYNGNGTLINSVDIIDRGNGELNVYANDLSSGVYTYSLVADGKIVATKRMVKY